MTLTLPTPDAGDTSRQRFALELLLQQPVPGPEQLLASRNLLDEALPDMGLDQWRALQAMPIAIGTDHLDIAIPSQWRDQEWHHLIDQLPKQHRTIRLHPAIEADLQRALHAEVNLSSQSDSTPPQIKKAHAPAHADTAGPPQTSTEEISTESFLEGFNTDGVLENDEGEESQQAQDAIDLETRLKDAEASPVVTLVDRILLQAMSINASDIHVEPQQKGLRLRFRQDGVLQQYVEPLPSRLIPAVTSRFKILADLDIAERRQAQDGRIRRKYRDRVVDFRVNTLPSRFGEKVCLRLLDSGATQLGLDKLISDSEALALVRDLGSKPFGMILVTGPTGSGKSTTLYSLLAERNDPGINISTVEDPIEYTLPGITQCQVNREKGFDFATALRAFMRQDPDVLLVGETRDLETAKTAIEAALTGHLVLSTLHANDAPSTIARLDEMGVEPFMVSASLIGIVSQRLLRRVCPHCREPYQPGEQELGRFGLMASRETQVTFFKAHHHGPGEQVCSHCKGSGYKGRVGVYEVLRIQDDMATAISRGASTDVIRQLALESGMVTLLGYSLELVRKGETTLEEVGRMVLTDSGLESERRARALSTMTCEGCGAGLQEGWLECPYCLTPRH
ncbi:type II/IV secretion system protein [Synechococcus sp. HB1133]|uniref:GspE/PulE family protein n=1 Tax=unclassified Synechococcus TaxID=2626047 RepID=UPI00140E0A3F|nr:MULTISPECIES: GspE/PulE family protein [unclassified Synechococcus]MCB4421544.1 type II/IV secretion system protein [Synechococcus sp. HB1133]MCB4431104.1 type II/IV secretion system protein [Synechococcus sp. HBA1120]NHI80486.1 type II/IV secretion system protein [Synechococcus sp. HB1133]